MENILKKNLLDVYSQVITQKRKYTNCYLNIIDIQRKIEKGFLSAYFSGGELLLIDTEEKISKLYFYCNDWKWIDELQLIGMANNELVVEIIKKNSLDEYDVLCEKMQLEKVYKRLRRVGAYLEESSEIVEYCCQHDFDELDKLITNNFELLGDHIPTSEELIWFIENRNIICVRKQNQIAGFIIFEDKGKTSYIRMVCVNKDYRGKRVGDLLMKTYFQIHKDYLSFTLWYNSDNIVAYNLYSKYGYTDENLYDYIFVVKSVYKEESL